MNGYALERQRAVSRPTGEPEDGTRSKSYLDWELGGVVSEGDRGRREVHTDPRLACDDHATTIRFFLKQPDSIVNVTVFSVN